MWCPSWRHHFGILLKSHVPCNIVRHVLDLGGRYEVQLDWKSSQRYRLLRHDNTSQRCDDDTTGCQRHDEVSRWVVCYWALLKVSTCSSAARRGSSSSATRVKISPSGDTALLAFYQQVSRLKAFGPHHIIVDLSKTLLFQLWFYFSLTWSIKCAHSYWIRSKVFISKVQNNEESLREHPAKDERLDSMLQKGTLFCGLLS